MQSIRFLSPASRKPAQGFIGCTFSGIKGPSQIAGIRGARLTGGKGQVLGPRP